MRPPLLPSFRAGTGSHHVRSAPPPCVLALLALLLALFPLTHAPDARAQTLQQRADAVAKTVFNLLSYARWPSEPAVLRLCVERSSLYSGKLLDGGTLANGRPVRTRVVDVAGSDLARDCDALYVGTMTDDKRKLLGRELSGQPVLVISEGDFECEVGSMFCLSVRDTQVSFRVNLDSVARSGIHVHPGVLQLGRRRGTTP